MSKMQKAFEKNKKYLILFLVLWIVLEIVLIAPMSVAIAESSVQGKFDLAFLQKIQEKKFQALQQ